MNSRRPIGIFDSGVGGLTVLKEIKKRLPHENIIYFGDTKHLPYGSKSKETVTRLSTENVQFLLRKNVKFVIVACNTSSALSLKLLQKYYSVPMLGVVEPGALSAVRSSKSGRIGVIGTKGTIESLAYNKALLKNRPNLKIFGKACPLFVPLVEEGWLNSNITELVVKEYLKVFKGKKIDTLVLGCTHYPFLKPVISRVLKDVKLIDSATETAKAVEKVLTDKNLLNCGRRKGNCSFYVSDAPEKFKKLGSYFMGYKIPAVMLVDVE